MDRLNIRTQNRKFETAKDLYGIFLKTSTGLEMVESIRK